MSILYSLLIKKFISQTHVLNGARAEDRELVKLIRYNNARAP